MSQILNICIYPKSGVILYLVVSHKWPYPRKEELKVIWGKRQCLAVSHLCPNLSVTTQCGDLSGIPNSWTFLPSLSSFFSSHLWRLRIFGDSQLVSTLPFSVVDQRSCHWFTHNQMYCTPLYQFLIKRKDFVSHSGWRGESSQLSSFKLEHLFWHFAKKNLFLKTTVFEN